MEKDIYPVRNGTPLAAFFLLIASSALLFALAQPGLAALRRNGFDDNSAALLVVLGLLGAVTGAVIGYRSDIGWGRFFLGLVCGACVGMLSAAQYLAEINFTMLVVGSLVIITLGLSLRRA